MGGDAPSGTGLWDGDDASVRAALVAELRRLKEVSPFAALGLPEGAGPDAIKARFVSLTKVHHPNRFARRPPEILRLASQEGLSQIDFHTHPGEADSVTFSTIDDEHERALAGYLARRLPETRYGSVVLNSRSQTARLWNVDGAGAFLRQLEA